MNDQNSKKASWWTRHKKKVYIIGGIIIVAGVSYVAYRNRQILLEFLLPKATNTGDDKLLIDSQLSTIIPVELETPPSTIAVQSLPINNGLPYLIHQHPRRLPEGRHPSPAKLAEAAALGLELESNQTLVDAYYKNQV